ncbi:hypothetical protein PVK06_027694 [Gossypium arboreum]|uniref:Putative plant transposon protein domain-containing protein n=1 Tax=Gossypium arboreum TaxID=29729 RepID=A0ABR0P118_GOSAR|nr:hypothetical protein PVK06_027694 [Gossypium arboreum]
MPRKRTRTCAQIDETQNKFHYKEAKARYESIFKNQQMHPEKGFTLKERNHIDFMARIRQVAKALNWELFCEKRSSVDEELVREFYANLTSSELTEVLVHGIKVPITSNAINKFFELPDFKNDDYSSLMSNIEPENLQEILEELIVPCFKWTVSKQGIHTSQREYLTQLTKTIDVGKIILREMRNCAIRHSGPAYFPFTITILCLKAKILANVKKTGYSQDHRDELSKLMDIMQHMQWQQQAYWRYSKKRDNSIRSALKKIYNDPFIFVPEFPDFIFEPWSPLSKKE